MNAPKPASTKEAVKGTRVADDDPRRQRLEALLMTTPGTREQIDELIARKQGQLDVALDTARRLSQARA